MTKSPEACPESTTFGGGGGGSDSVVVPFDELEELELLEEVAELAGLEPPELLLLDDEPHPARPSARTAVAMDARRGTLSARRRVYGRRASSAGPAGAGGSRVPTSAQTRDPRPTPCEAGAPADHIHRGGPENAGLRPRKALVHNSCFQVWSEC